MAEGAKGRKEEWRKKMKEEMKQNRKPKFKVKRLSYKAWHLSCYELV